jgi:hypothetical protein
MVYKKSWLVLVIVLAFGMLIVGCKGNIIDIEKDPVEQKVEALPSFEGSFVSSEAEASTLAVAAQTVIKSAIDAAIFYGQQSEQLSRNQPRDAVNISETYTYNGITLSYRYTETDEYGLTYPFSSSTIVNATVNGTYGGYTIKGRYYFKNDIDYTAELSYTDKIVYDCVYVVSGNGKGMKLVQTGDVTLTSSEGDAGTYSVHLAVYDNDNVRRYNYDYEMNL